MTLGQQAAAQQRVSPKSQLEGERQNWCRIQARTLRIGYRSRQETISIRTSGISTGMIRHSFDDGISPSRSIFDRDVPQMRGFGGSIRRLFRSRRSTRPRHIQIPCQRLSRGESMLSQPNDVSIGCQIRRLRCLIWIRRIIIT